MSVVLLGSGPAANGVRAALADQDVDVESGDPEAIADASAAVVVGVAGTDGFDRANEAAVAADADWIAVEIGGVGGRPVADLPAAVSGFGPDAGCYRCLRTRVAAAADGEADADPKALRSDAWFAGALAGRTVIRSLSGESVAGRVVEVPHAERTFLPVPGCPVCGTARDRSLDRTHREESVEEAVARAEGAVDDRLGPVAVVGERESYPAPYYLARLAATAPLSDADAPEQAAGVDADWNAAYVKALGEALERYSAAVYREAEFEVAPVGDVSAPVSPEEFVRPDGAAFDPDDPLAWVPGENLHTGEAVSLPAEFVQFPPPEERFRPAITTGLGLGGSPVAALCSGLRELIERDATMLAWYSTFEPLGLSVDRPAFGTLARRARAEGLAVAPVLLTQDVDVPVVAVAVGRDRWPRFAAGSAAGLDAGGAAVDALSEALQNWMELRALGPENAEDAGAAVARYADDPGVAGEFFDVDTAVPAEGTGPEDPPTGTDALDALLDRADAAGLDAYATRLTPRDVESLGFEAVRVLAPRAQPLFLDDAYFGERARSVPRHLGFRPRLDRDPHPFP